MQVWCRVRSLATGAHIDVPIERLDALLTKGAVVELDGRRHTGAAKPPKPRRQKGVGSSPRRRRS